MAEFITRDLKVLISETPEASYNTTKTTAADVLGAVMTQRTFAVPILNKLDDVNKVGTGFEFATTLRPDYWTHPVMTLGEDLNSDMAGLLFARALGGTVTTSPQGGAEPVGWEHTVLMQSAAQGRQLPSSNLITSIGNVGVGNEGADFQLMGVCVDSFTVSQNRAETPTWGAELVGSGKFVRPNAVVGTLPAPATQNYVHGAAVVVTLSNGSPINLSTEGRIRSWSFTLNNNLRRDDRRPGDPFRVSNDPSSGAYVNRLLRGPRTCSASITVSLSQDMREWISHRDNVVITDLTILCKGNLITGGTGGPFNHLFEIKLPKSYVRTVASTDDNDDAALTIDFFPVKGSGEYVQGRILGINETLA